MPKKCYVILLFVMKVFYVTAQNISVASFKLDESDMTAMQSGTSMEDQNGEKCALIKVETSETGFSFDVGSLGVTKIVQKVGEVWVYVPHGVRKIAIAHQQLGVLRDYSVPVSIQKGRTYIMKLTTGKVITTVKEAAQKQFLVFDVQPKNATLEVNEELWQLDEFGHSESNVGFGTYSYRVSAKNYHSSAGKVVVDDPKNKKLLRISLKPAFGWLEVSDETGMTGADVYVDNEKIGQIPLKSDELSSGMHEVKISKKLYKTFQTQIQIADSAVYVLKPVLEASFAETTLSTSAEATIYIDGELKGKGTWKGPLEHGQYTVECKQESYRSTSQVVEVSANSPKIIQLQKPLPIYGSLEITSTPSDAKISIDGKSVGSTPLFINDEILIGKHEITFSKPNYKDQTIEVTIVEGKTETVNTTMNSVGLFSFSSNPSGASLTIDGNSMGTTPLKQEMASGDYDIVLTHNKYKTYRKRIHLDSSSPSVDIKLERQYLRPSSFYIQPFFQVGSNTSVGGSIGMFISNVNIEGYYAIGMKESEMIYWNSTKDGEKPCGYVYKTSSMGGRIGYGLIFGTRMRLTPQLGVNVVNLKASDKYNVKSSFDASEAYVVSASVGAKFEYAFANCLGAFLAPEYDFAVKKSDYFNGMEPLSSTIKGFGSGFNLRLGVSLFF